jgi:hypothetical protein
VSLVVAISSSAPYPAVIRLQLGVSVFQLPELIDAPIHSLSGPDFPFEAKLSGSYLARRRRQMIVE